MLYAFFKSLFRLLVWAFYRNINVENQDRVPPKGPVILVSNHPNTMMDPVLLALFSGRNPHFLGKSTLFKTSLARWFFGQGKVIPVYRKQEAEDEMHKNAATFLRCYEALEKDAAIVIMPEGISQLDGTLQPIKTGTARIALETEERNGFKKGIQIIPAGINYADPTRFNQDVYCRFGKPILVADYQELFENDPVEAVYELTEQIREALAKLTTTVKHPETAVILDQLSEIYKQELITDLKLEDDNVSHDFSVTRGMVEAIDWFFENEPKKTLSLQNRMRSYLAKIEGLQLKDDLLVTGESKRTFLRRLGQLAVVVFGAPVFVWGTLNNYIPYKLPLYVVKWLKPTIEFRSTYIMVSGLAAFLIFYPLQIILVWVLTGSTWWTLAYVVALLPAGKFALSYRSLMQNYRQHLRLIAMFTGRKNLVLEIIEERVELIQALDGARQLYMELRDEEHQKSPGPEIGEDDLET